MTRFALIATVGLAVLLAWGAPSATAKKPPREFYGVVPQTVPDARDYELMAEDRVGMVRQLINWPWVEAQPGVYDWSYYDGAFRQATAVGIRVWPVLYGTPAWAQSEERNRTCGGTCAPASSEARDGFARFAAAAAASYGPGGSFWTDTGEPPPPPPPPPPCPLPPLPCRQSGGEMVADRELANWNPRLPPCQCSNPLPIEVWQIWNEQNSEKYFGPQPDVNEYAQLLKAAAAAIRARQGNAEIVLGGMWGPGKTKVVTPVKRYLRKLLRVADARSAFDSIALHPYAPNIKDVLDRVRQAREVLNRKGAKGAGIWVTELGWASGGPRREPLVKGKREQARLLRDGYRELLRKRGAWKIRGVQWYSWRDAERSLCAWCPKSGLRTKSGAAKPAAKAFRKLPRSG